MKLSRHLNFAICENFAFFIFAFLSETNLEIPVDAAIRMEASTKNVEASERFKQLVEQHYKEPVNGQLRIVQTKSYLEWRRKAVVMKRTSTLPQNTTDTSMIFRI